MTPDDLNAALLWRNFVADWHLDQGMPDCGCDDDTPDTEFCAPSTAYADEQFASRPDPALDGPEDPWSHDSWVAAWGHNVPLVAAPNDFLLPSAPKGMSWLATRVVIGGRTAVDLALYRFGEHQLSAIARARVVAEPTTVQARARAILQDIED